MYSSMNCTIKVLVSFIFDLYIKSNIRKSNINTMLRNIWKSNVDIGDRGLTDRCADGTASRRGRRHGRGVGNCIDGRH
jgi:hypothetical protein